MRVAVPDGRRARPVSEPGPHPALVHNFEAFDAGAHQQRTGVTGQLPVKGIKFDGGCRRHQGGGLGRRADLLREPGVPGQHVFQDPDHPAVVGACHVPGHHGSLLGQPVPLPQVRGGAHLAGPVGEGGHVQPVLLHQVGAQARRDAAAAVEVVDEPGIVHHEAALALAAPGCRCLGRAEDVVPAGRAVHPVMPQAELPFDGDPEAQPAAGVERQLPETVGGVLQPHDRSPAVVPY